MRISVLAAVMLSLFLFTQNADAASYAIAPFQVNGSNSYQYLKTAVPPMLNSRLFKVRTASLLQRLQRHKKQHRICGKNIKQIILFTELSMLLAILRVLISTLLAIIIIFGKNLRRILSIISLPASILLPATLIRKYSKQAVLLHRQNQAAAAVLLLMRKQAHQVPAI